MNKLLLLHELLNMVNKDKCAEIYNTDHYFNIKLYDYLNTHKPQVSEN